jgi:diadenosine tetraphosphate (Ap4A) HIT family hydrolase
MEPGTARPTHLEDELASGMKVFTVIAEALAKTAAPTGYRVVYRTNPKGEHVVAVIWPPQTP